MDSESMHTYGSEAGMAGAPAAADPHLQVEVQSRTVFHVPHAGLTWEDCLLVKLN